MRPICLILLIISFFNLGVSSAQVRQSINIPDILGYKTITCDLHLHSVFSDGQVWPTVRVDEAWQEGIDAIRSEERRVG